MKIGLTLPIRNDVDANSNIEIAKKAEILGFDSIWVSDHVVIPEQHKGRFTDKFHDPFALLSAIAGVTENIRLGTSLIILPYRNPIVVAKMISTLDQLSDGRVIFGIGTGWIKEEFETLGVPFTERGKRTNEYIQIIKNLWTEENPSFNGQFYKYKNIKFDPKPLQKPYPKIIVGGNSKKAKERSIIYGNGWQPTTISPEEYIFEIEGLKTQTDINSFILSVRNRIKIEDKRFLENNHDQNNSFYKFGGAVSDIVEETMKFKELGINLLLFDPAVDTLDNYFKTMDIISKEILPAIKD